MTAIAAPTASAAAMVGSGTAFATKMPTSAEMTLPPNTGQGCASGLAGTAKSSTADAPMGATSSGWASPLPSINPHSMAVMAMPPIAPLAAFSRSNRPGPAGPAGMKAL